MRRIRLLSATVLTLIVIVVGSCAQARSGPPQPLKRYGACPFECCVYREWTAVTPIAVYAAEGDTSTVAFTIAAGESFTALTGNVHIEEPGVVIVTSPVKAIRWMDAGDEFTPGDTLFVLDYMGEGFYNVWFNDSILEVERFWIEQAEWDQGSRENADGYITRTPRTRWWVHVRNRDEQEGWIEMTREVGVHGADACA